jgi:DNA-directed RNA polymerase subunit E"
MPAEQACRNCGLVTNVAGQICPRCKTHTLSEDFSSIVIIIDPATSEIARRLNITEPGKYALKVR